MSVGTNLSNQNLINVNDKFPVELGFTILPNGASAPSFGLVNLYNPAGPVATHLTQNFGVVSVTRSSQGVFLVTLSQNWRVLYSCKLSLQFSTPTAVYPQLIGVSNTITPTITITTVGDTGTATDIAANASNAIHVKLNLGY